MLFLCLTRQLSASLKVVLGSLLVSGLLIACSPVFDWRDVLPEQAPFAIALPGKPAEMSRNIHLDGDPVTMQMVGARAGGLVFTAAWARVNSPDDQQSRVQKTLAAMQTGMINNISGQIVKQETRNLPLLGPQGAKAGLLPAVFVDVSGQARGQDVQMQAMFAAVGDDVMQFVVLGESFSPEAATTFFESLRVRIRAGAAS